MRLLSQSVLNMHIRLRAYTQLDEKMTIFYKSWIFKCVAVAVAVAVVVAVAVAPASAANKTFIFKCVKCLRIIIMTLFHIFTLNSKSGCDFKIAYSRGHA